MLYKKSVIQYPCRADTKRRALFYNYFFNWVLERLYIKAKPFKYNVLATCKINDSSRLANLHA